MRGSGAGCSRRAPGSTASTRPRPRGQMSPSSTWRIQWLPATRARRGERRSPISRSRQRVRSGGRCASTLWSPGPAWPRRSTAGGPAARNESVDGLRFAEHATPRLIWVNFAHLFMVSLVPFSTAWVADTRMAAAPVFVYAAVFVLVNLAYCVFVWETLAQAEVEAVSARMRRITLTRSFLTLGMFVIAMLLSLKFPLWGFGSVCCVLLVYLWPEFHI
jgi:hypothetical protein